MAHSRTRGLEHPGCDGATSRLDEAFSQATGGSAASPQPEPGSPSEGQSEQPGRTQRPGPPGLDTSPSITGERTRQGKRIGRHQSRGAMNISCPGLHTARLSPPRAPGGPPQPLITTKGSCRQAEPPRRTPPAAPPDPHHPRLGPYLSRQTLASPARRPAEPPDHVHPPLDL